MKFRDADNSYSFCEHHSWWLHLCHRSDILECIIGEEPVVEGPMRPLHTDRVIQVTSQWQDLWPQPSLWHRAQISPRLLVNDSTEKPKDVQLHQNRGGENIHEARLHFKMIWTLIVNWNCIIGYVHPVFSLGQSLSFSQHCGRKAPGSPNPWGEAPCVSPTGGSRSGPGLYWVADGLPFWNMQE